MYLVDDPPPSSLSQGICRAAGQTLCVSTRPLVPGEALYRIHRQSLNTHRGKHRSGGAEKIKAQQFRGKFRDIFRKKIRSSKKRLGGNFGPEKKYLAPPPPKFPANTLPASRPPPPPTREPPSLLKFSIKKSPPPLPAPRTPPSPPPSRKIKNIRNVHQEDLSCRVHSADVPP